MDQPSSSIISEGNESESNEAVFAVVVTFHPAQEVQQNLAALRPQVSQLFVVDNGSSPQELEPLRQFCATNHIILIENGANLGIATALNIGVRHALEQGCKWILLFDQDSCVSLGFVAAMLQAFAQRERTAHLGLLVPTYRDLRFGTPIPPERLASGQLSVAMTSGSLLRAETFRLHGLFVDELFIDLVDHEYCLRLRAAGYIVEECAAVLLHSPGTPLRHRWLGWCFETANYSPVRRYYQERNKIWVARHYFRKFPAYCLHMFIVSLKDFVKIVAVERENKWAKIRSFFRGLLDGIRNRMGPMEPGKLPPP